MERKDDCLESFFEAVKDLGTGDGDNGQEKLKENKE